MSRRSTWLDASETSRGCFVELLHVVAGLWLPGRGMHLMLVVVDLLCEFDITMVSAGALVPPIRVESMASVAVTKNQTSACGCVEYPMAAWPEAERRINHEACSRPTCHVTCFLLASLALLLSMRRSPSVAEDETRLDPPTLAC